MIRTFEEIGKFGRDLAKDIPKRDADLKKEDHTGLYISILPH